MSRRTRNFLALLNEAKSIGFRDFLIRAGVAYIDHGLRPNAFADPAALFPDGPDGTVLLGLNLFGWSSSADPNRLTRD